MNRATRGHHAGGRSSVGSTTHARGRHEVITGSRIGWRQIEEVVVQDFSRLRWWRERRGQSWNSGHSLVRCDCRSQLSLWSAPTNCQPFAFEYLWELNKILISVIKCFCFLSLRHVFIEQFLSTRLL